VKGGSYVEQTQYVSFLSFDTRRAISVIVIELPECACMTALSPRPSVSTESSVYFVSPKLPETIETNARSLCCDMQASDVTL